MKTGRRHLQRQSWRFAYLVLLYETMGEEWMTPDLFRFGASSLLNDVLMQFEEREDGRVSERDYFTID